MPRVLKFRAWGPNIKRMWSHKELLENNTTYAFLASPGHGERIIMQFTGLLDCRGKEVYEGDILRAKEYNEFWDDGAIGDVTFEDGSFRFNWKILLAKSGKKDYRKPISTICSSAGYNSDKRDGGIKVIGNLYEHPHLMTPLAPR